MDLSFTRFEADTRVTALTPDLAMLMVGIFVRQAASETALAQTKLAAQHDDGGIFAPAHGAFNLPVAEMFTRWKGE